MEHLPTPYLRTTLYRVVLWFTERSLGEELLPADLSIAQQWGRKIGQLRDAALYFETSPATELAPREAGVGELWREVIPWLDRAGRLLDCSAEGDTAGNIERLSIATRCLTSVRRRLRVWQDRTVEPVVTRCEGWKAFEKHLLEMKYDEFRRLDPGPTETSHPISEKAFLSNYRCDFDALSDTLDVSADRPRCERSRDAVFSWGLLRSLYPHLWKPSEHRRLVVLNRDVSAAIGRGDLRNVVAGRVNYLEYFSSDEPFRRAAITPLDLPVVDRIDSAEVDPGATNPSALHEMFPNAATVTGDNHIEFESYEIPVMAAVTASFEAAQAR